MDEIAGKPVNIIPKIVSIADSRSLFSGQFLP